jgi:DNA modification methylase
MSEHEDLKRIDVTYDQDDVRWVTCFCGKACKISLIPHLKKEHPDKWEQWRLDFVRLKDNGWSYKRIMWKYRAIFSWSVIDRETRKVINEGKACLRTCTKPSISEWDPDFSLEKTTIWDFRQRGNWAVHQDDYRGNWPPQLPRNLILRYTHRKNLVLDPFVGGGTTLIEAYLLSRKSIGIDLSPNAIRLCRGKIKEMENRTENRKQLSKDCRPLIIEGDAHNSLKKLTDQGYERQIDLVCAHPPYLNSIVYTNKKSDLSRLVDLGKYCEKMGEIAREMLVLLKKNGICAILLGDVRKDQKMVPLGFKIMNQFLEEGFSLRDIVIKLQHQDKSTQFYENKELGHYLLQHEYLFIFEK